MMGLAILMWDLITPFWVFWSFFALLPHPINNLQNQHFKWKKPGAIIALHQCTINDNNIMYDSWDMQHDRQEFVVILDHFLPFTPLTTRKNNISKKRKKHLEILLCSTCVTLMIITWRMVLEIWSVTDRISFCHFWLFFAVLPP